VAEPILRIPDEPHDPRPALGYAMVATAASLFAVNGVVAKVIEATGFSSQRLTEVRSTAAFIGLAVIVALTQRDAVRTTGRELVLLAALGVGGLALVQWSYFFAIHRLAIGQALLIQYVAPLIVAIWARFVYREPVRRRVWIALALSISGLVLIVQLWRLRSLDGLGLAASAVACASFAFYILTAERGVARRDAISLSAWGFLFAALFWAALQPWWTFPGSYVRGDASLLGRLDSIHLPIWVLVAWMVVLGTIVPYVLVVGALRHISATRVGIVAMLEPVGAIFVAWIWLGEALAQVQIFGATLALTGIVLAQTAR
jgi:drug/metabolite transporter (DMT)-like permease